MFFFSARLNSQQTPEQIRQNDNKHKSFIESEGVSKLQIRYCLQYDNSQFLNKQKNFKPECIFFIEN